MPDHEQPKPPDMAELLAERFFELLREKGSAVGVTRFFTFHPWRDAPGEVRQALTAVFEQLQRDAIEQRQAWAQAAAEAEIKRLRAHLEEAERTPGRYTTILEERPARDDPRFTYLIPRRLDPSLYLNRWPPLPVPQDAEPRATYIEETPADSRLPRRDCAGEPLTAGFREPVPADVMTGAEFDRLKALDWQVRAARYELFRLSERLRREAAAVAEEGHEESALTVAGRLEMFAFEFETILVRFGLAPAPEDFPKPKTLEVEATLKAADSGGNFEALKEEFAQLASVNVEKIVDFERMRKAGREILQLCDRLRFYAVDQRGDAKRAANPVGRDANLAFAEFCSGLAEEFETIVYEAGLASKPAEGSAEG
jgi:hypothetical protein